MVLSKKAEYAISIIIYIRYSTRSGGSVTSGQIYDATGIPAKYLSVILSDLQRSGILKSIRGFKGGYILAKAMREITVRDIINATARKTFRQEKNPDNLFQNFSKKIASELVSEYEQLLAKTDFETLYTRFENSISPMTPMFYI